MIDEPIPFTITERGELLAKRLRIEELEHILRHFDRTSMTLFHYIRSIDGLPTADEWQVIREQIDEMVDPYGPRNPHR
ncbi:MAG TPA: hypothetical protein VIG24_08310 [Acidimicrobiia bacterium]